MAPIAVDGAALREGLHQFSWLVGPAVRHPIGGEGTERDIFHAHIARSGGKGDLQKSITALTPAASDRAGRVGSDMNVRRVVAGELTPFCDEGAPIDIDAVRAARQIAMLESIAKAVRIVAAKPDPAEARQEPPLIKERAIAVGRTPNVIQQGGVLKAPATEAPLGRRVTAARWGGGLINNRGGHFATIKGNPLHEHMPHVHERQQRRRIAARVLNDGILPANIEGGAILKHGERGRDIQLTGRQQTRLAGVDDAGKDRCERRTIVGIADRNAVGGNVDHLMSAV